MKPFRLMVVGFAVLIGMAGCGPTSRESQPPTITTFGDLSKLPDANLNPTYGQTVLTKVNFSSRPDLLLNVTVSRPLPFTPSRAATVSSGMGSRPWNSDPADAAQAPVYFDVTITNTSSTDSFTADVVVARAVCKLRTGDKEQEVIYDYDAGIGNRPLGDARVIAPGASLSFKDGASVACADDVQFRLQPAGLASRTLTFHK